MYILSPDMAIGAFGPSSSPEPVTRCNVGIEIPNDCWAVSMAAAIIPTVVKVIMIDPFIRCLFMKSV
jgi:hypothetical protein